jgi:hypothetical protein
MREMMLFVLILLFGCSEPDPAVPTIERPADLIEESKMVQVMADVHMLEAAISATTPPPRSRGPMLAPGQDAVHNNLVEGFENRKPLPYYDVFVKHQVSRDQYERSMQYYSADPAAFALLYDKVIAELTKRHEELKNKSAAKTSTPN